MLQNIFLIAGLFMLFGGLVSWYRTRVFLARCVKTKGVVVSHEHQTDSEGDDKTTSSFPIFRFIHPITGTEYSVRSNVSGLMQEGQEIEIVYDPQDPENAKIDKLSHTWMIPIITTLLGVFFSFFGVLARNTTPTSIGVFDKAIIFILVIVLLFTLNKYVRIRLNETRTHGSYRSKTINP
jgi:hypothetical protein